MSIDKLIDRLERIEADKADLEEIVDRQNERLETLKARAREGDNLEGLLELLTESLALNITAVTHLPRDRTDLRDDCFRRLIELQLQIYIQAHPDEPEANAWKAVGRAWSLAQS